MAGFRRENSGFNRDSRGGDRGGRGGGFGRRDSGSRGFDRPEMFQATCDKCGKSCQVPFRPTQGKPVYCSDCYRENGDSGRSESRDLGRDYGRNNFEEKQMYQAKCDECGNNCEVPFRPTEGKPVYCQNCFGDKKHADRGSEKSDNSAQLNELNAKLDKILSILDPQSVIEVNEPEPAVEAIEEAAAEEMPVEASPKKSRAPKTEAPVEEVI